LLAWLGAGGWGLGLWLASLARRCFGVGVGWEFVYVFSVDHAGYDLFFSGAGIDPGDFQFVGGRFVFGLFVGLGCFGRRLGAFGADALELAVG